MLRRFWKWLRRYRLHFGITIISEDGSLSPVLQVKWFDGTWCEVKATKAVGLHLACERTDGGGHVMVSHQQAKDPAHFVRLWRSMGGEAMDLQWEDGTSADPF